MHELFEAIFGTCPHGLPGWHWLFDMWYAVAALPMVMQLRLWWNRPKKKEQLCRGDTNTQSNME